MRLLGAAGVAGAGLRDAKAAAASGAYHGSASDVAATEPDADVDPGLPATDLVVSTQAGTVGNKCTLFLSLE